MSDGVSLEQDAMALPAGMPGMGPTFRKVIYYRVYEFRLKEWVSFRS